MYKYKCVIFDCDGVLVDSEPIGNEVLVEMTNELGGNIELDFAYEHFKGNSIQTVVDHISKLVNHKLGEAFISEYRERSYKAFKEKIKPVTGVEDVIKKLQIPFCVASSGPIEKIKLNLNLTGLLPYFEDKIFSCYTIQKWKPEPDIFLLAAKTMGFLPEDCLVIEDSEIGVQAAKNGGFNVFSYTEHDYNGKLAKVSLKTFDKMSSLPALLTNI
ncbi:MAG: HAD family hydrolase [Winogradskyella sp.]|uniref:HAD family hydrolase n=1 Tax=Winogradskyella sp. TaxID=1883156 RepID=UPI000F3F2361|nr:HAD family hydrolase [Winogradskyella sp.]RNC83454.1 MAG: HAD family hydrolase [Winogradskyella sp.]